MFYSNNLNKRQKGYSLIEVVMTIAIAGVVLVAIYLSLIYALKINLIAKHLTIAYQSAEQEMEFIRNTPFANLTNRSDDEFIGTISNLSKLDNGQGTLTIRNYQDNPDIKEIIIKITWLEKGSPKEITLSSLRTEGGIGQ